MMNWAKITAYTLGYVLVTQRSKKYKNGFIWKVHLMCDRGGQYSTSHGYWTIRVVCDQHNHLPTQNLEGHAYPRRLSDDEYRLVEDLTWKNVRPREILLTLKDQNMNNLSTLPTIYDAQHKIRKIENAGKTPMQILMSLLHINHYVYEPFINPVTNEFQALFFVHPLSYEIWRALPHVLIIDDMYKTNLYKMPFVQIVGVTSIGKTFCIAFVFISEEKMDNYKWALEQLKLTLNELWKSHNEQSECIPLDSIDIFWRTLNLAPATSLQSDNIRCDTEINQFKEHFNKQPEVGKRSFIRKLVDIFNPSKTTYETARFALGLGLSEDQWPQVRSDLVRELRAHRERYKYVFGSLGYDNTYKTVKTAGEWMLMPNTSLVIASAYNRVVICLADGGSVGASTIRFPLWSNPPQSQPRENIVIAYVNGNHYIRVTLQEGCPLPLTHSLWLSYKVMLYLDENIHILADKMNFVNIIIVLLKLMILAKYIM
ncbi:FAR1-related sequence 5-like protein [Tanacetum coccineum]|uniref:FAR1-related sequence 5-like protein n=1 Tax=Tanacetum coccineum TaxID=301880 RepID=A0ABQ5A0K5_9ASTR